MWIKGKLCPFFLSEVSARRSAVIAGGSGVGKQLGKKIKLGGVGGFCLVSGGCPCSVVAVGTRGWVCSVPG